MNVISVDPGLAGACAVLNENGGLITVFDVPVTGDGQRRIDRATLAGLIRQHMPIASSGWRTHSRSRASAARGGPETN